MKQTLTFYVPINAWCRLAVYAESKKDALTKAKNAGYDTSSSIANGLSVYQFNLVDNKACITDVIR